jgi:ferredoxin-NADP reductase
MPAMDQKVMKLSVSKITVETPDTKTFRFDLGSYKPFPFLPGQFIIVTAELFNPKRNKVAPVNRAFSISSSPLEEDYLEITVKKYQDGRMTPWLHDSVVVGQAFDVKGPDGKFVFREGETDELVLIAGGIGIAPYRSIIRYILARGLPVRIRLIYSARTPADFAYQSEFDGLVKKHPNFECLYTVTREHEGWTGRTGRVDATLLQNYLGNPKALYYICGPDQMIKELTETLRKIGVADEAIRSERW